MSADLYDSEIDSTEYGILSIWMNVHNFLFTTMYTDDENEGSLTFTLPPNPSGKQEAKKIIDALQYWLEHVSMVCTCGEDDETDPNKTLPHKTDCPKS